MIIPVRFLTAMCVSVAAVALVHGAEPAIIAKARARLASDAVLDAVTSLRYVGTLVTQASTEAARQITQSVEIVLQKPAQQRMVITSDAAIEISGLDGYDAWSRTIDAKDPNRWQQSQKGPEQVKQLRADVWENLSFFRGIERIGGRVLDEGPATIDGIACRKLAFYHSDDLVYLRYFNEATGELIYTGTSANNIREQGEMFAGGIRFPKAIVITQTDGVRTVRRTITFEKITVNERFPASLFTVPLPSVK